MNEEGLGLDLVGQILAVFIGLIILVGLFLGYRWMNPQAPVEEIIRDSKPMPAEVLPEYECPEVGCKG